MINFKAKKTIKNKKISFYLITDYKIYKISIFTCRNTLKEYTKFSSSAKMPK